MADAEAGVIPLRLVTALGLLALLVPAPGRSAPVPTAAPACRAAQLRITLRHSGAALGTVGGYISFRNTSWAPCRLTGWPTVVATTAAGKPTMAVRRHSTMFGPDVRGVPVVTLRHGERAEAVFTSSDVNPRSTTTLCPSFRFFQVGLPGKDVTTRLSAWITGLGAYMPNCSGIQVSMFVPAHVLDHG